VDLTGWDTINWILWYMVETVVCYKLDKMSAKAMIERESRN
jgi:hypothetical protein